MKLNPKIFRSFSIRGIVGEDFDAEGMVRIGQGVGKWFLQNAGDTLVVGYDVRKSSPQLHMSLCNGLLSTGIHVIDIGLTPTPMLNFAVDYYKASGGVMITASHNPPEYNGLKIRSERTIYGEDLKSIYRLSLDQLGVEKKGKYEQRNPLEAYVAELLRRANVERTLRVVIDGGNGVNGQIVPNILRRLGIDVIELFCDLDGNFPNRDPDPTSSSATYPLTQVVLETKSDIGIAFDGDGDRIVVVDEIGNTIFGDKLLMLLSDDLISHKAADKVVYEVLCSQVVPDYLASRGAKLFPAASGYAFVHNVMLSTGAQVGGEMSGHLFLLDDVFKFDDAILASLRLLSLLSSQKSTLSKMILGLPRYYSSREYRLHCLDDVKGNIVKTMREYFSRAGYKLEEIDGVRVDFGDAWALVRQSNTQPVISLRFEARDSFEKMQKIKNDVLSMLKKVYEENNLVFPEVAE